MIKFVFLFSFAISLFFSPSKAEDFKTESKRPVILIQGLGCLPEVWDEVIREMPDNYKFYKLCIPGYAGEKPVKNFSSTTITEIIFSLINKEKLQKPVIIGHSFGGFSLLKMLKTWSNLVSKIIIVDAYSFPAGIANPATNKMQVQQHSDNLVSILLNMNKQQFKNYLSGILKLSVKSNVDYQKLLNWYICSDKKTLINAQTEMIAADLRSGLKNVQIPVLVMSSYYAPLMKGMSQEMFYNA